MAKSTAIVTRHWAETLDALVASGALPGAVHRILLYSREPGTGKSSWASHAFGEVERVPMHGEMLPDDLIGTTELVSENGATVSVQRDGPAVRAMRFGRPLVLDEVDQHSADVRCKLHAILDDLSISCIVLPSGERIRPAPGFCVIGTTNKAPSALTGPLLDRFDIVLNCSQPAPGIANGLTRGEAAVLTAFYSRIPSEPYAPNISVRRVLSFAKLAKQIDRTEAAALVFGQSAADVLASIAVQD